MDQHQAWEERERVLKIVVLIRLLFARPSNQYGPGPFSQIRVVVLTECGSHAIVDATIGDETSAERCLAEDLLPSLDAEMFLFYHTHCHRTRTGL